MKLDAENAFNSILRATAVDRTSSKFPTLKRFLAFAYGTDPVAYLTPELSILVESGILQGDPLGSLLFGAAVQPLPVADASDNAHLANHDLSILADHDDIYLVGSPRDVVDVYQFLVRNLPELNLSLNAGKSVYLVPESSFPCPEERSLAAKTCPDGVPLSTDGIVVVGAPVGSDAFVQEFAHEVLNNRFPSLLRRLKDPRMDTQIALLILLHCVIPQFVFYARTIPSHLISDSASLFDRNVLQTWSGITHTPLTDVSITELTLPTRRGGSALRSAERTLHIAHYSSLVASCVLLADHDPDLKRLWEQAKDMVPDDPIPGDFSLPAHITSNRAVSMLADAHKRAARVLPDDAFSLRLPPAPPDLVISRAATKKS